MAMSTAAIQSKTGNNHQTVQPTIRARAFCMTVMPRFSLHLAAVAMIAVVLAGCGRSESYRYKLTLAINTPEGVKRASAVVEVLFYDVRIPERGTMHKLRGQALYLDL